MSSHQVTLHMETSRSQARNMTPRKKRRERDGTRESREPLGTLGSLSYLSYCYPLLIYIHLGIIQQLLLLLHSFVSLTVLQMKPMKFLSSLSKSQDRKMTPRKMRERTILMNRYLLTHPGNNSRKTQFISFLFTVIILVVCYCFYNYSWQ